MAEKIQIGAKEPLYKAAEKINGAIDEVNTFQTQIDQLVIEGDSSVEAAQARVDTDGVAHTTLKERLDVEHSELTAQLAQTTEKTWNKINIQEAGCIADAIQIDYTYGGTGTTLDGKTRKVWSSQGNNGLHNRQIIQSLLDGGYSLFVPEGYFYIDGLEQLIIKYSGFTLEGSSVEKSKLIGASFISRKIDNLSDITLRNVSLEGIADVTPPSKLKSGTDASFDSLIHFDLYDSKSFTFIDGAYKSNFNASAFQFGHEETSQPKNITLSNVHIKNFHGGVYIGTKTDQEPLNRLKNVRIVNTTFENIVFQAIGANNIEGVDTQNCNFRNVYFQPIDYSRGCKGARIHYNTFDNCATLGKVEGHVYGTTRILSDNFDIYKNRYINPPITSDVHFDEDSIISNLTGDGKVSENVFEVSNKHSYLVKMSPKYNTKHCDVRVKENLVTINGAKSNILYMVNVFDVNSTDEVKGIDLTIEGNKVTNNVANTEMFAITNYSKVRELKLNNNEFLADSAMVNNYFRLYDGYLPENKMLIGNNKVQKVFNELIRFVTNNLFTTNEITIVNNNIKYMPSTSLISRTAIMISNSTGTNLSIGTFKFLRNEVNFPVLFYALNADVDEVNMSDNEIFVESDQTNIGQTNMIYRTNSYTKKFIFERNIIRKGNSQLTFLPVYTTSSGKLDVATINDNQIDDLDSFGRTANTSNLTDFNIKGNSTKANGTVTLLTGYAASNVGKGYFLANVIESPTYNANYFSKIRDAGNIINATTINENNKVLA